MFQITKTIKILFILILFLSINRLFSQIDIDKISEFFGEWEGIYILGDQVNSETMKIDWIIMGRYIQIDVQGIDTLHPLTAKWYQRYLLTIEENYNIKAWYFDENGYSTHTIFNGKMEGSKIILIGKLPEYIFNVTFELKDNKLHRYVEWEKKGNPKSVVEAVFNKVI
jgi:hypothetical protein